MSKSTNKIQLQQLLSLMEQKPEIARGFFKGDKQDLERFWRSAEQELNSLGPPSKSSTEWKKVWTDQKKYVRQKAAQNLQYKKGTGGGPNREHSFSATEQSIYDLIGMKTSVEGVAAKSFGLESPSNAKEMPQVPAEIDVLDVSMQDALINEKLVASTDLGLCETPKSFQKSKDNAFPNSKGESAKSASNMLLAELAVQKELVETVKEAVGDAKDQKESIKRIYRSLDSIYGLQKKHFQAMEKMKREQIDEMRRHNTYMEEMRLKEVEYKLEKNRLQFQFNDLTTNN